ncbi:MAG: tRNA pseudouridine(38-40) synthase TruA [Cytophagales bacterium]|nr:tRNA pseudouridine(38-40) synthase TruA [Rhizobacter sp.]
MRLALGICYRGQGYNGWQSQPGGRTVQDQLERALSQFAAVPVRTMCAGRTDTGVHGLNQVIHIDPPVQRELASWVRGTNRYLPSDIAVQWCHEVEGDFHARNSAQGRRYAYLLLESAVRPALESGVAGWTHRSLTLDAMQDAAGVLIGEHDFSAFRSSECQAASPVKLMRAIAICRAGAYWRFDFDGSAFLHHMVRNIMGCLLAIGSGQRPAPWMHEVLASRSRQSAAPTFPADGLYFVGPYYDPCFGLPTHTPAMDWLPNHE